MKALTIKEPWASLIIEGYKEYEFRSWKTKYRGKLLIHSGMSTDKDKLKKFLDNKYDINIKNGFIIGEAELVDCIPVDEEFSKMLRKKDSIVYAKSGYIEEYAWKLENVKKYEKPIPYKGQLGLWNYEE